MKRTPLKRKTRLRARNPERRAAAFARNFGDRGAAVRAMRCLVPGCRHDPQAAHAIARGMGGVKGSLRHLVPLCSAHHRDAGENRTSQRARFEAAHGLDLIAEAERIALLLDAQETP